jgi:hypothetical protein
MSAEERSQPKTLAEQIYEDILDDAHGDLQEALQTAALLLAEVETERRQALAATSAGYVRRKPV